MKKHIVIISLIVMYSALCFASSPKWLIDLEKAFPSDLYIRAVGEGVSESSAKKVALSELSAYFHQTISFQTQSLKRIDREDSYFKETADVRQKLNTSTESELFSVQYTKSFYDKNSNKFYICAYIEKDHAWNVISQKMDITAGACKSYLDSVKNEPEDLLKVINLNRAEKFFAKFNSLYEMALVKVLVPQGLRVRVSSELYTYKWWNVGYAVASKAAFLWKYGFKSHLVHHG